MKKQVTLTALGITLFAGAFAQSAKTSKVYQLVVTNTSSIGLTDKAVTISRNKLTGLPKGDVYPLIMSLNKKDTIPAQLDDMDGDNKWDELFFVADLPAKAKKTFSVKWVTTKPEFEKRTSLRFGKRMAANIPLQAATSETLTAREIPKSLGFQRYQTDGPSWENDKVGFRHYLDGRNAKDVFGKLVPYMSPETVGINAKGEVEDNYHVMEKWGRDILAVGNSVGIGGICVMKGDSLLRLGVTVDDSVNNVEKTTFSILSEGPVRSAFTIKYDNWKPAETSYGAVETVSIWPGMYAYKNTVKVSGLQGGEHLGIGIVNINAEKQLVEIKLNKEWVALISHEKNGYNKEWWVPLALLVPAKNYLGFTDAPKKGKLATSYFARLKVENNEPISYYAIAGWENSDKGFIDPEYFKNYVVKLGEQLSAPVTVTIK